MDGLDLNKILNRKNIYNEIKSFLNKFFYNSNENLLEKRGIFISGCSGSGKTNFILNLLKDSNLDVIYYDASQIRNKNIIENINKNNISNRDIVSLFYKTNIKHSVIIMNQIDNLNTGDKGSINALIKLIRPKKTKKQKLESICNLPIICISNSTFDKKIKELIKVTNYYEINLPTTEQTKIIIDKLFINVPNYTKLKILNLVENNLKKIQNIYELYLNDPNILNDNYINTFYSIKKHRENTINLTEKLITKKYNLKDYFSTVNETDRTILGLLWHENIINILNCFDKDYSIKLYIKFLNNICYADFLDRITFQKLIWQFNEIACIIKIFYNNYILFNSENKGILQLQSSEKKYNFRFTKILTKYSNQYNNYMFIISLSYIFNVDKKDLFILFEKNINNNYLINNNILEVSELDIKRLYKYIENLYNYKFDYKKIRDYTNSNISELINNQDFFYNQEILNNQEFLNDKEFFDNSDYIN